MTDDRYIDVNHKLDNLPTNPEALNYKTKATEPSEGPFFVQNG